MSTYQQIYHVDAEGNVSSIAGGPQTGSGGDNGPATSASINCSGILVDGAGDIYIADTGNNRIRRIDTAGMITTYAGNGQAAPASNGPATSSAVWAPVVLAMERAGNLYAGVDANGLLEVTARGAVSVLNPDQSTYFVSSPGPISKASIWPPR